MKFDCAVADGVTVNSRKASISDMKAFVNNVFYHYDGTPEKITMQDAIIAFMQWIADDVEIPEGMTPAQFTLFWNRNVKKEQEWASAEWFEADDDDSI